MEDLSRIVEGYVEFIKLTVLKQILKRVLTYNALFQALFDPFFINFTFIANNIMLNSQKIAEILRKLEDW